MSMIPKINASFGGETIEFMESKNTSDYIKREDAKYVVQNELDAFDHVPWALLKKINKDIDEIPTTDVVEVVRCKDCKWFTAVNEACGKCTYRTRAFLYNENDDYCSYGERKEHSNEHID